MNRILDLKPFVQSQYKANIAIYEYAYVNINYYSRYVHVIAEWHKSEPIV